MDESKNRIYQHTLIVTCEACSTVNRYRIHSEEEAEHILSNFKCENKCDSSFCSYILIGKINLKKTALKKDTVAA
ncbi:hypothetical protein GF407_14765 [candidate division KSB1 bacterium]|nr:hypothetical protein [candidate division KSB1 bacterium]